MTELHLQQGVVALGYPLVQIDVGSAVSIADKFKTFLSNIAIDNAETISLRYGEITAALNKNFRDTESKNANSLQVGSYGRWTAIKGISDLDMLYIMPARSWNEYNCQRGQYKLLKAAADAIRGRYPKTTVKVDRLVVRVLYENFHVEVQPVFEEEDGSFTYPDTYGNGAWKTTKPCEEIAAMSEFDAQKNKNLRRLCKMSRAWKNKHGVGMGGLLIDTLAHNFLQSTSEYDTRSYLYYDYMSRDFFAYLAAEPNQDRYAALCSKQHVKAKKAYDHCVDAINAAGTDEEDRHWRKVYGRYFPKTDVAQKAFVTEGGRSARDTEQFIEDKFPVDIRNNITLECRVIQRGFQTRLLRDLLQSRLKLLPLKRLEFYVQETDIEGRYGLYWKVLNRGPEAVRRDMIRGQIEVDAGHYEKTENTNFRGDHVVECYAVQDGVVIATDRIHVPISENEQ